MLKLVITVELLIGFYTIAIDQNYIISAITYSETGDVEITSIIDMQKDSLYLFEKNEVKKAVSLNDHENPGHLQLSETKMIVSDEFDTIANYRCQAYYLDYHISGYLNGGGESDINVVYHLGEVDIIDKYIYNEKARERLPYIGTSDYSKFNKYKMKTVEITHREPLVISEISKIEEVEKIDSFLLKILNKAKTYSP